MAALKRCLIVNLLSLLFIAAGPGLSSPAAAEQVLQVKATSGANLRALLTGSPDRAKANIMLLTGGNGVLKISGKGEIKKPTYNFLVRTRRLFAKAGYLVAVVDAPLDRREAPGLLGGFRASSEHAADLSKVVRKLRELNNKPVIVIGTSRGTVSAANVALRDTSGNIRATVLTSSMVKPNKKGKIITDLPLSSMKVPMLFVHNRGDTCKVTLLSGVKPVVRKLRKAGLKTELIVVSSRKKTGRDCGGRSPHGFLGLEQQVVDEITGWINPLL